MTTVAGARGRGERRLVPHLERQLESARRLLAIVLAQGEAIRAQDAAGVLARLVDLQGELAARVELEREREEIVEETARRLGVEAERVDLEAALQGASPEERDRARRLSAELRGVLVEAGRRHEQNRLLVRQELAFLSHLMRVLQGRPQGAYSPEGWAATPQPARVVDARA
mgnify:CR=1 FL=1